MLLKHGVDSYSEPQCMDHPEIQFSQRTQLRLQNVSAVLTGVSEDRDAGDLGVYVHLRLEHGALRGAAGVH